MRERERESDLGVCMRESKAHAICGAAGAGGGQCDQMDKLFGHLQQLKLAQ